MNTLVRIQSRLRGLLQRNKIKLRSKNPPKNKEVDNLSIKNSEIVNDNQSNDTKGVQEEELIEDKANGGNNIKNNEEDLNKNNDKITKEEIDNLFNKYPPLEDNVEVTLKPPKEIEEGKIYYGEWDNLTDKKHGRGIILYPDGTKYEGYLVNDKCNIKGKYTKNNEEYYEGEWKDDKKEGDGVLYDMNGYRYEGKFKNNKQNGYGVETWADGNKFEGNFEDGVKKGNGKFSFNDGNYYDGLFENNNMNGKGTFIWKDGRKYEGDWIDNKMEGQGIFQWPDGKLYKGSYKNDKKSGHGQFEWANGRKYSGEWEDGKQNGEGRFFNPKKQLWKTGIWENGKNIKWNEDDNQKLGGN